MDEVVGSIYSSNDYNKFRFTRRNRELKSVSRVLKSVGSFNALRDFPILVDKEFFILDGQNRFEVSRKLGLPIYYLFAKVAQDGDLFKIQAKTMWGIPSYLRTHQDKEDYRFIGELWQKYKIDIYTVIYAAEHSHQAIQKFKRGEFFLKEDRSEVERRVRLVSDLVILSLAILKTVGDRHKVSRDAMNAFLGLVQDKRYNHARMVSMIRENPSMMKDALKFKDVADIGLALKGIYNKSIRDETKRLK